MKPLNSIALMFFVLLVACTPSTKTPDPADNDALQASTTLAAIDSLMWRQPDSALAQLQAFCNSPEADSLDEFNGHYCQLLISELLYKNYAAQSNREELLQAVAYFDSIMQVPEPVEGPSFERNVFLAARAHYINGVGYYERDSVVEACAEYLKALEVMESSFAKRELVQERAQFMALTYTHLTSLFSDLYLHEQAIDFGKQALPYYQRYDAMHWHVAWILDEIGLNYEMMSFYDSANIYFKKGISALPDTSTLLYRDLTAHRMLLSYETDKDPDMVLDQLYQLLALSEGDKEFHSRCLSIGGIYFHESQFDSAYTYLNKVFINSENINSKKQAAEWLVEICKAHGKYPEAHEYADFLVPFGNLNENNSHLKSQLAELSNEYDHSRQEREFLRQQNETLRIDDYIIGGIFFAVLIFFLSLSLILKRRRETEHDEKTKPDAIVKPAEAQPFSFAENYADEPICQYILSVCNDNKNPIKSTVPYSAYSGISLDNTQMAQLKNAAYHHYGTLFEKLGKEHPELKVKDYQYCFLCLLGLDNVQIAALLQKSNSTIWDREKRLQKILDSNDKIAVILQEIIIRL